MPRTTGVDILNIKPDAEMGLAQDTSIPVPAVALDQTNKANDDLRLYDHQINLMKYQQKIKDRDRLLEGLEAGQVAVGDIEPEDKRYFDEAEQKARKAFLAVKTIEPDKNGQNKEYQEWMAAQQDLKDEANILQLRRAQLQKLRTELAGTISPSEKKAREKHLAEQKAKNPHETITPFQKSLTIDLDKTLSELQTGALISDDGEPVNLPKKTTTIKDANGKITTTTTEKPTDKKPVTKSAATVATQPAVGADGYLNTEILLEPGKKWSLPEITKKAHQMYLEPSGEGFAQIQGINDIFQGNPDDVPKEYLKKANEKLALFHQQNEIGTIKVPDASGGIEETGAYPHQINYRILKDGTIRILDNPADFAAKLALANVGGDYVMKPKKGVNEKAVELNLKKAESKARIGAINALAAQRRASANLTNQKSKALDSQFNPAQTFGELFNGKMQTSQGSTLPSVNVKDMSKAFVDNLGIDPATDDGDFKIVPVNVKFKGIEIPEDEVQKMYARWLDSQDAKNLADEIKKTPDIFDFLFAKGAEFSPPEVLGRVKPVYSKNLGVDGKPVLLNPNEAGKPTRSNALQSWIEQRKQMKVTGGKLIMEDNESSNDNIDNN